MKWEVFLPYLAVMAIVTYLIRMVPMVAFRRQVKSRFVRSFLAYVPYAVLTAMTVPDVLYCTGYTAGGDLGLLWAALGGLITALILAWRGRSLITVALGASAGVAVVQGVLLLLPGA